MRVKTFYAFSLVLMLAFGCTEDKIELNLVVFESSEISFTSEKSELSLVSQVLGMNSFKGGIMEQANRFVFSVEATKSLVNGRVLEFDESKVSVIKTGFKQYVVEANLEGIGFTKLSTDLVSHSTTLEVGKDRFVNEQFSGLKNENHIALIVMVSLLNDILIDHPIQSQKLSSRHDARIQCGYYGYTIGWGWTQEQAVDHESCVRDSACENIQRYSCEYLGSSTTCGFGAIGCVTISTFRCDDGKACN